MSVYVCVCVCARARARGADLLIPLSYQTACVRARTHTHTHIHNLIFPFLLLPQKLPLHQAYSLSTQKVTPHRRQLPTNDRHCAE